MSQVDQKKITIGNLREISNQTKPQVKTAQDTSNAKDTGCSKASSQYSGSAALHLDQKIKLELPIVSSFWSGGPETNLKDALVAAGRGDVLAQAYLKSFIANDLDKFGKPTAQSLVGEKALISSEDKLASLIVQFHQGSEEEKVRAADTLVHYILEHADVADNQHDLALGVLLFLESLSESDHTDALYQLISHLSPQEAQLLECLCKDQASPKLLKAIHEAESSHQETSKKLHEYPQDKSPATDLNSKVFSSEDQSGGSSAETIQVQEQAETSSSSQVTWFKPLATPSAETVKKPEATQSDTFTPKLSVTEAIDKGLGALEKSSLAQYVDVPALKIRLESLYRATQDKGSVTTANTLYIAALAAGNQHPQFSSVGEHYAPLRSIAAQVARSIVESTGIAEVGQDLDLPETQTPAPSALVSGKKINPQEIRQTLLAAQANAGLGREAAAVVPGTVAPNSSSVAAGMMAALAGQWKFGGGSSFGQNSFELGSRPSYYVEEAGHSPDSQDGQGQGGQESSEEDQPKPQNQSFAWA